MGNLVNKEKPPPMVLVPPMFDFPPLAARTRMLEPSYDLLFGKLALRCLFNDYFEDARHFNTRIMLKPIDDPNVDLIATVSGPFDKNEENILGDASFRWQRDLDDPHTFIDLYVSNADEIMRLRSCAYYPQCGVGAFGVFPLLVKKRIRSEDYGVLGLRYGSENLAFGATFLPFPSAASEFPKSAWLVGRLGRLTAGMLYKPEFGTKDSSRCSNVKNWSWAIGYGLGSSSPLSPSFNFSLEFAKSSQLIASFYQHLVVQRKVKNPFEEDEIVGITNYIDVGFELETRIKGDESSNSVEKSTFQAAASWQANKNILVKAKIGTHSSSIALALKSWWRPSFTFNITAVRDHLVGKTSFGFGLRIEDLREASYQRADPNYVMLTPTKEHLAEGIMKNIGKRPMLQSDIDSGNFDSLPRQLKPLGRTL